MEKIMEPIRQAKREEMRPDPGVMAGKELSSRERAELRAKAVMEARGGTFDEGHDEFYVDWSHVPDGWTVEWKRYQTFGMDLSSHHVALARNGWEPCMTKDFPDMMPIGTKPTDPVTRQGMMLMTRPMILTEEQRRLDHKRAVDHLRSREESAKNRPAGDDSPFDTHHNGESLNRINRKFGGAMEIPD